MRIGRIKKRSIALSFYFVLLAIPIYWMLNMSLRRQCGHPRFVRPLSCARHVCTTTSKSLPTPAGIPVTSTAIIYVSMNTVMSLAVRPARGLRVLALQVPGRQADVLLAADQPHGAARGLPAALSSSSTPPCS
ncbi:MAG: hypothetical protein MZV70_56710 [Desulfobacterales bacterium]|nr:hypothetical protein [Desulfobacterales bacterium]